ncbi:MAG: cell division protein FtsQ/DivIB [Planktomarina sp.]
MQPIAGEFRTIQPIKAMPLRQTGFQASRRGNDPAPSRMQYKMDRWLLSPLFKSVVRVGIPGAIVAALALTFLSNEAAKERFTAKVSEAQQSVASRPEYQIEGVSVAGASPQLQIEVTRALGLSFPSSGLDLDLAALQTSLTDLPAIEKAHVALAPHGLLQVNVQEVPAVAVWRSVNGLHLVSGEGDILRDLAQRVDAPTVPLIAGAGAPDHLVEAAVLLAEATPIAADVRGLVRVGQRRWDIVLTGDRKIALPETSPVDALRQVLVLAESRDLLNRDISVVDFRVPHRPTVRLKPHVVEALRQARGASIEGFAQ